MSELNPTELVAALGTTAAEIAATLANKGIRGWRSDTKHCPIAVYLRQQGFDAIVGINEIITDDPERDPALTQPYGCVSYPMTVAGHAFVSRYDHGDFPELDND